MLNSKKIMADNIQRLMDMYGKSRNDVCKDIKVSYTTFTDWVKGNAYPRPDKVEMLAKYFGVTVSDLVTAPPQEDNNITLNGSNHGAISGSGTAMVINGSPISVEQAEYCLMCHSLSSGAREQINNMIKMLHELEHKK